MNKRLVAYLLLILATALWGIGGPVIKYSFNYISPTNFLFWRFVIASIISLPILFWYLKKYPIEKGDLPKLILLSLLGVSISLSLTFAGIKLTTIVEAAIIGSLTPMFVAIGSALFLGESLTRRKELGIILAISGTVVAVLNPLLNHQIGNKDSVFGNLLLLAGGLTWVLFVLLSKKWSKPTLKPFHTVSFSALLSIPFFYLMSVSQTHSLNIPYPNHTALLGIAYMAIFATLIAFTAYESALRTIDASEADLFNYLGPVWSVPLAIFWLGEKFEPALIISIILIAIGIFIAEYKPGLIKGFRGHHLAHHK